MKIVPKISVIRETRYEFDFTPEQVMEIVSDACKSAAGVSGEVANFTATASHIMAPVKVSFSVADGEVDGEPATERAPMFSPTGGNSDFRLVRGEGGDPVTVPRHPSWVDRTHYERSIVEKIEAMPSPFSPVQDLNIVQSAVSKLTDVLADEMGVPQTEIVARWKSLWFDEVLCGDKHPTEKGIARLLAALRYRVAESGQND